MMRWSVLKSPRVLALASLAALATLEFALRAAGFAAVPVTEPHRELGWVTLPDQERPGAHGEGLSINAWGFRDRDWTALQSEPQLERIAFLGDSRAYAASVPVEQGFVRDMEFRFSDCPAPFWAMNFAQPGYGLEQMQRLYSIAVRAWKPSTVVVCVGSLSIQPTPPPFERRDFPLRRLAMRTALWDFLDQYVLRDAHSFDAAWERAGLADEARAARDGFRIAREAPFEPEAEPLWARACERLAQLEREVALDGARLVVLVLPRADELAPERASELVRRWKACAAACDRTPVLVDASAALREVAQPFSSRDALHFSEFGHAAVASALLDGVPWVAPR